MWQSQVINQSGLKPTHVDMEKHWIQMLLFSDDLHFVKYIQMLHEVTYYIKTFAIYERVCTYRLLLLELIIGKRPYLGMMDHM